ncbi:MAG: DUF4350 domain-containing protein [Polyangiaceae bacterium]|nr:DUF4350 domain-containing protein [Polyangiaceae bacterium]
MVITSATVGLHAAPTRAAPYAFDGHDWEGASSLVDLLVGALGRERVVATHQLRWQELKAADGLVVLYPQHSLNPEELSAFLRAGGRVALLDDFGASEENVGRFKIRRAPAPKRPARSLRNNPALAIAEPVSDTAAGRTIGVHPAVANVTQVVTNHPSALVHPGLTPALRIAALGEPDATIAVAGQVGRGRLFVVSDASIVINQMLRYPGNRAFAQGLAQYLVEDDTWGKRGGKLYVVARSFEETGAFANQSSVGKTVGAAVRDFGRRLNEIRANGVPTQWATVFGALAALGTLLWVVNAAARQYRRTPPRFARPLPLVAMGGVAGRAAVLAAPSTHRALAVLELKSALEEAVAARFGLRLPVSAQDLLDAVTRARVLSDEQFRKLKRLLFKLGMIETSVASGRPVRVRERDVQRAAERVHAIIAIIEENGSAAHGPHRS